jgi:aspartyl/glutamyl-tRNA(Asn/Gln) amidotransferase C subunit
VSSITRADIRTIADLAELHVDEASAAQLEQELRRILDFVGQLNELPQDGAAEIPRPAARLRRDEHSADPLSRPPSVWAPGFQDGLFVVPRLFGLDRGGDA